MKTPTSPDKLAERAEEFYAELSRIPHDRYLSWEHCYDVFNSGSKDIDYLSLHLAFYLASWGMYRGSSFLLQRDYRVHYDAVKILMNDEFEELRGIKCRDLSEERIAKVVQVYRLLEQFYKGVRSDVQKNRGGIGVGDGKIKSDVSQTLITKIMMGTLGCCPAYDRYFVRGLREQGFRRTFSNESLKELVNFYQKNQTAFHNVQRKTKGGLSYPQMKILDMAFWKQGFHLENNDNS